MITNFKIFESIDSIQTYLEKHFRNKIVFPTDKPIKLGFHTEDYIIDGISVRLEFASPFRGSKATVAFHPLTKEQIEEMKKINSDAEQKKVDDKKYQEHIKKISRELNDLRQDRANDNFYRNKH